MTDSISPANRPPISPGITSWGALALYGHPRWTALMLILIFGIGFIALVQLPKLEDPPLSPVAVKITTLLPGADAEQVEIRVTEKLEAKLLELPELKKLRSQSRTGASVITFEIKDSVQDPEFVFSRLRSKVQDARAQLPEQATEPIVEPIEVAAYAWIGAVVCDSPGLVSPVGLRRYALQLRDELRQLPGTKQVDLYGEQIEEVTIRLDPAKEVQLGISPTEIADCLARTDAKQSAGTLVGAQHDMALKLDNHFHSLETIASARLRDAGDGRVLLLRDVATIERSVQMPASSLAIVDGRQAVLVAARPDSVGSVQRWTHGVQAKLHRFQSRLPVGIRVESLLVQSEFVSDRMWSLLTNLLAGLLAVGVTTSIFLGWSSAFYVTMTLPLGCFMVLAGLHWLQIPLHQMSVTGLILSLGLMIDNAIIVADELGQSRRRGHSQMNAIALTMHKMALPLIGSTATTVFAFVPLALMPGPTGEFVGSIGIAVILSLCSSLLIALTLLPAVAIRAIPAGNSQQAGSQGLQLPHAEKFYQSFLQRILHRPVEGIALGAALPVLGFAVATMLPEQFFPAADRDQFLVELELDSSAGIQDTLKAVHKVERILRTFPELSRISWLIGETSPAFYYNHIPQRSNTPSYAQAVVESGDQILAHKRLRQLQTALNEQAPGMRVTLRQFEQGPPTNAPIEIQILGDDLLRLHAVGATVQHLLVSHPNIMHVRSDMAELRPVSTAQLDARQVHAAGLDEQRVALQLFSQLEGLVAGTLIEPTDELPVRIRTRGASQQTTPSLEALQVFTNTTSPRDSSAYYRAVNRSAPLASMGTIAIRPERAVITHFNGERVNELQAYVPIGQLPSVILRQLNHQLSPERFSVPSGCRVEIAGVAAERAAAIDNLNTHVPTVALAGSVLLVLTLGSFRMASIIGVIGVLSVGMGTGSLWLLGYPIGFTAIIGVLGLVGIAINDSIVVLTALREDPLSSRGDVAAMVQTIMNCTRHVLCTSATTVFGFLPLILGGGSFWPPLAVVIGCGITGATLTAVTFVPCLFRYLVLYFGPLGAESLQELEPQPERETEPESVQQVYFAVQEMVAAFSPSQAVSQTLIDSQSGFQAQLGASSQHGASSAAVASLSSASPATIPRRISPS